MALEGRDFACIVEDDYLLVVIGKPTALEGNPAIEVGVTGVVSVVRALELVRFHNLLGLLNRHADGDVFDRLLLKDEIVRWPRAYISFLCVRRRDRRRHRLEVAATERRQA